MRLKKEILDSMNPLDIYRSSKKRAVRKALMIFFIPIALFLVFIEHSYTTLPDLTIPMTLLAPLSLVAIMAYIFDRSRRGYVAINNSYLIVNDSMFEWNQLQALDEDRHAKASDGAEIQPPTYSLRIVVDDNGTKREIDLPYTSDRSVALREEIFKRLNPEAVANSALTDWIERS